jgi:5'-deoxynucleotidase YfbR-like HD superfamily hydrolase
VSSRRGPWIETTTGRRFYLLSPRPEDVFVLDIATALSQIVRFTGHCRGAYTVAQHSVWVSQHVRPELALHALLHDAHEAYTGDLSSPLKAALRRSPCTAALLRKIVDGIDRAIAKRFALRRLRPREREEIRRADLLALATERRDLMSGSRQPWEMLAGVAPDPTVILSSVYGDKRAEFLRRLRELTSSEFILDRSADPPAEVVA